MGKQPTYEELEERVKILKKESIEHKRAEEALQETKERYTLATRAAMVGVWDWNVQTGKFYLDPNVKAILGYSDEEIPNDLDVWANYVHPDDKQAVMEAFQAHLEGKTPKFIYEHRMFHKDGSVRWIFARGTAIRDAQGNAVRVMGTDTDITLRKRAEEALRESEKRYRALVEDMPALICRFLPDCTLSFVNTSYCRYFDKNPEELVSKDFFQFIPEKEREKIRRYFQSFSEKMPVKSYEHQVVAPNGEVRWQRWTNRALFDEKGNLNQFQSIGQDITDQKQAENALQEKDHKLERQAQYLKEVNTALNVLLEHRQEEKKKIGENMLSNVKKLIFPYIDKLEGSQLNDKSQTYIEIIKSNLKELISPFANTLSSKYANLTPTEIQIADLIKHGRTSKEIASLLNVSLKAISFHRGNIRKKLGLANKKINLRSHLKSLTI